MSKGISRDKGLLEEGRVAGWYRDSPGSFAEPGVRPHFGPDLEFQVSSIALQLRVDPKECHLEGLARVGVRPTPTGMGTVRLDLDEVVVDEVSCVDERAVSWRHDEGVLEIKGLTDAAELLIRYRGAPRRGLYFVGPEPAHPNRAHQVWSQCQDEDGHFFFPCVDHPSVRQSFRIELEAPAQYTVVSNGELVEKEEADDGWMRWTWNQEKPIPAYLVTVVVAKLDVHEVSHGDLPVRYLVPEGMAAEDVERIFGRTPEMIAFFEERFGVPFAWPRYDQVVVEDFIFGGMENAGATTLTSMTVVDERTQVEWNPDGLIAHELAHQWFGDLVTCRDWSQGWLNEGWATYSEVLWTEHAHGKSEAAWNAWDIARGYFQEPRQRYTRPIVSYMFREPIDLFDRHLYNKAGCVLHTLRCELGEDRFWPAVSSYLQRHGPGSVLTRDFQRAVEEATGRNLDGFFQQWIHAPGHPVLKIKLSHENGLLTVALNQKQKGEGVPRAFSFSLRIVVVEEDGTQRIVDMAVTERVQKFALPCEEKPRTVRVDPGFRVLAELALEAPKSWCEALLESDACPVVRIRAAESLGKSAQPSGIAVLAHALTSEADWYVRVELARILGKARGDVAQGALLDALDTETDLRVRTGIVSALGRFRHPDVQERLARVALDGDASLFSEAAAVEGLGKMQSPRTLEAAQALMGRADAGDWGDFLVMKALSGIGALRDAEQLPVLKAHAAETHSQRIRAAALGAMAQLGLDVSTVTTEVVDLLVEQAGVGPFRVCLAAVAGLGRLQDARGLGVLTTLHGTAPDGRVRRMAWEASRKIRAGKQSTDTLRQLQDDLDAESRRSVGLRDRLSRLEAHAGLDVE